MMMKINRLFFAGALLVFLASCNGESTPSTPAPAAESTPAPAPAAPEAPAPTGEVKTAKGTFVEISWGDYPHFVMNDETDEEIGFWIAEDLPNDVYEAFESGKKKGAHIEVSYRVVTRDIPENGGPMEVEEVFAVKEL